MNTEQARQRLLARREELRAREARLNAGLKQQPDLSTADFGDVSKESERSGMLSALSRATDAELRQIGDALLRLEEGRYGICATCCGPIEPQRLEVVPYADQCIRCAEARETRTRRHGSGMGPSRRLDSRIR